MGKDEREFLVWAWAAVAARRGDPCLLIDPATEQVVAWTDVAVRYAAEVGFDLHPWTRSAKPVAFRRLAPQEYVEHGLEKARRIVKTDESAQTFVVFDGEASRSRAYHLGCGLVAMELLGPDAAALESLRRFHGVRLKEAEVLAFCMDASNRRAVVRLDDLADSVGLSVRSVRRCLRALEQVNAVEVTRSPRGLRFLTPTYGAWCASTVRWGPQRAVAEHDTASWIPNRESAELETDQWEPGADP